MADFVCPNWRFRPSTGRRDPCGQCIACVLHDLEEQADEYSDEEHIRLQRDQLDGWWAGRAFGLGEAAARMRKAVEKK